jgi:hypothetical protein
MNIINITKVEYTRKRYKLTYNFNSTHYFFERFHNDVICTGYTQKVVRTNNGGLFVRLAYFNERQKPIFLNHNKEYRRFCELVTEFNLLHPLK